MFCDYFLSQGLVQVFVTPSKLFVCKHLKLYRSIKKKIRFERNDRNDGKKRINNHSPNNLVLKTVLSVYL